MNKESAEQRNFELVYGTAIGSIFHGEFYLPPRGALQPNIPVADVLMCQSGDFIYDIKIVKTDTKLGVIAVTENGFH
jgi:hypothetical protein